MNWLTSKQCDEDEAFISLGMTSSAKRFCLSCEGISVNIRIRAASQMNSFSYRIYCPLKHPSAGIWVACRREGSVRRYQHVQIFAKHDTRLNLDCARNLGFSCIVGERKRYMVQIESSCKKLLIVCVDVCWPMQENDDHGERFMPKVGGVNLPSDVPGEMLL